MSGEVSTIEPEFSGQGRRVAIVVSRFNQMIGESLLEGARSTLIEKGVAAPDILVARVPGAYELPVAAKVIARGGEYDAVICLGAVVRGETPHFDYVAGEAARGLTEVSLDTERPILFGVLTTDTMQQAVDRAGGRHGNKGEDTALGALEMVNLLDRLREKRA